MKKNFSCLMVLFASCTLCCLVSAEEYLNGIKWEAPAIITPGATNSDPPSDATVLFDGTDLSQWINGEKWIVKDGVAIVGDGKITTKEEFGDCQLHIEWSSPVEVKKDGQGRGNSGVFFMDAFEIQVLDSFDNETYHDGQAGAIYKQTPPQVNVNRPPGEWNVYDLFWTAPRFGEDGKLVSPAYLTAILNGVLVQNHFELKGDTPYFRPPSYENMSGKGPISLQDHNNPVRFRNIWVRSIKAAQGEQVRKPFLRNKGKETPIED
ncbi:MAG: DUF1080 domain-containing protein [Rubripirellula sp.]